MKRLLKNVFLVMAVFMMFSINAEAANKIPKGAGYYNYHAYAVYPSGTCDSYEEAVKFCKNLGGHLVTISSEKENDFVYKYVCERGETFPYIGLYKKNNEWVWANGAKNSYTNWAPGEPEGQEYVRYKNNGEGLWCDDYWGNWSNSSFVCEWDSKLTVSDSKVILKKGETEYIDYTFKSGSGKKYDFDATWTSSDKSVAKVSSKGKITAVAPGTCKVTCKVKGLKKTITVIVRPSKVTSVGTKAKGQTYIQLKWAKQSGVTKYRVYMYDKELGGYKSVKTVSGSANSVKITGLKKNKQYSFKVRAYVQSGDTKYYGSYSDIYRVKTNK